MATWIRVAHMQPSISLLLIVTLVLSAGLIGASRAGGQLVPNDDIASAAPLPADGIIAGERSEPGPSVEHLVYALPLLHGDTVVVAGGKVFGDPVSGSSARIFGPDATDVGSDAPVACAEEGTTTVVFTAPADGTYFLDILNQWETSLWYSWCVEVIPAGPTPPEIQPEICFEPEHLEFVVPLDGSPLESASVTVTVSGFETPTVTWRLTDVPEWLIIAPMSGSAPGITRLDVAVDTGKLPPGTCSEAFVQVVIDGPGGAPARAAGMAAAPEGHGRLAVRVDNRYDSEVVEFNVSPSEVRRTSTTVPRTTVSGRLVAATGDATGAPLAGRAVLIVASADGIEESVVGTVATDPEGRFQYRVPVARTVCLRAQFEGDDAFRPAWSEWRTCAATAFLPAPVAPEAVMAGRRFTVSGYLYPGHTASYPVTVLIERRVRRADGTLAYVPVATVKGRNVKSTDAWTRYQATVSLARSGVWRVRAVHADSDHKKSTSAYDYLVAR